MFTSCEHKHTSCQRSETWLIHHVSTNIPRVIPRVRKGKQTGKGNRQERETDRKGKQTWALEETETDMSCTFSYTSPLLHITFTLSQTSAVHSLIQYGRASFEMTWLVPPVPSEGPEQFYHCTAQKHFYTNRRRIGCSRHLNVRNTWNSKLDMKFERHTCMLERERDTHTNVGKNGMLQILDGKETSSPCCKHRHLTGKTWLYLGNTWLYLGNTWLYLHAPTPFCYIPLLYLP